MLTVDKLSCSFPTKVNLCLFYDSLKKDSFHAGPAEPRLSAYHLRLTPFGGLALGRVPMLSKCASLPDTFLERLSMSAYRFPPHEIPYSIFMLIRLTQQSLLQLHPL